MQVNLSYTPKLSCQANDIKIIKIALLNYLTKTGDVDSFGNINTDDVNEISKFICKLYKISQEEGAYHRLAASLILQLAIEGLVMLPFSGKTLRKITDFKFISTDLVKTVDKHIDNESPRWRDEDVHFRILMATDCRSATKFSLIDFSNLHLWLISEGLVEDKFGFSLPIFMTLRGIELSNESSLNRDQRHSYIFWCVTGKYKTTKLLDFISDPNGIDGIRIHGNARERLELDSHQERRRSKEEKRKSTNRNNRKDSPYIENLLQIVKENKIDSAERYFEGLANGSQVKGFRPNYWIDEPTNYPGRPHINVAALGLNWFTAFKAYLIHREKDYETDKQVRTNLHIFADYLFLYLPWWFENNPDANLSYPNHPWQFLRYYFVDRTRFNDDEYSEFVKLPKTIYELLHLRKATPDVRNTFRINIKSFFAFVITYFEDSSKFVSKGMLNPIRLDFDNEVAGRSGKTNKIPFSEDVFPYLVHYGQSVEAFGEFLQYEAYEKNIFKDASNGIKDGYYTSDWGYVPVFWFRGKLYRIDWIPNLYGISKRSLQSNPVEESGIYLNGNRINKGENKTLTLHFPSLTVIRLLNVMAETGLRGQSVQWLDRRYFDSLTLPSESIEQLYGNPKDQLFKSLYLNTDKSHNVWENLVSWRVRRSLLAERYFQNSLIGKHSKRETPYEDRSNSRFLPVLALFRSDRISKPVADGTYSYRWVEFLFGFQNFFNKKDGIDCSSDINALQLVKAREGASEDALIYDRFFAVHTPHACRATYATLKDGDFEVSEVAAQLGHSNTVVTNYYQVPSFNRLQKKLKLSDTETMGDGDLDPLSKGEQYLHPERAVSDVRKAFERNRDQAISDFGFVPGVALWSLSELDGDKSALDLLRQSPSSLIRWHLTHVCPVGNQCPREVVSNTGGFSRCGICPLAAKCIDHLPGMEAKQNELIERVRTAAAKIKLLIDNGGLQSDIDELHRSMQLDTKELMGWKLSAEILRNMQRESLGNNKNYHVDQPELVRKQLQLVTRSQSEREFFLQRIVESHEYPSLESAEIRAKALRYTRLFLAKQGRLEDAAYLDVQPHTEIAVLASLIKPIVDAKNLSMSEFLAALEALPQVLPYNEINPSQRLI